MSNYSHFAGFDKVVMRESLWKMLKCQKTTTMTSSIRMMSDIGVCAHCMPYRLRSRDQKAAMELFSCLSQGYLPPYSNCFSDEDAETFELRMATQESNRLRKERFVPS